MESCSHSLPFGALLLEEERPAPSGFCKWSNLALRHSRFKGLAARQSSARIING